MSDGHERQEYNTYRVRRKEHTPDKDVSFRASEAWMAAREFAEAFDLPNKSKVVVSYQYNDQLVTRVFEISVGKLYGASEQ